MSPMELHDPAQWPFRMTTEEAVRGLRLTKRQFEYRRRTGAYVIAPVDRGLWLRSDIWKLLGYSPTAGSDVAAPVERPSMDMAVLRERILDCRFKKRARPFPKPSDPARHNAYLSALELWLMPGVAVEPSGDSWAVSFKGRLLPVGARGAVRLTRETQILVCEQVRELRQGRVPQEGRF